MNSTGTDVVRKKYRKNLPVHTSDRSRPPYYGQMGYRTGKKDGRRSRSVSFGEPPPYTASLHP
jgi:hypothetical protein